MTRTKVDPRYTAGMSNKERREFVREVARAQRLRRQRMRRLRRVALLTTGALVAVAAVAFGGWKAADALHAAVRGPANMLSDGLVLEGAGDDGTVSPVATAALEGGAQPVRTASDAAATGVLDIVLALDLTSDAAATFWSTNGALLQQSVAYRYATLELRPTGATDADAIAAAAAFGCVADGDPDVALVYWHAVLQARLADPDSGEPAVDSAATAEVVGQDVYDCIADDGFASWAADAANRAAADGSAGTVTVAGVVYGGELDDGEAFSAFLDEVSAEVLGTSGTD